MAKKKKSNKDESKDIPKNTAIIIALFLVIVGWYIVSNPITTGVIIVLGIIAVIVYLLKDLIGIGILKKIMGK